MVEVNVPKRTYLVTQNKGENIEQTYGKILEWIKQSDYVPYDYDDLPIKYERYSSDSDSFHLHF